MSLPNSFPSLAILDHLPQGIFILRQNGTIGYWNSCLEDWTAISKTAIVDNQLAKFFPHLGTPKYTSRFDPLFEGGAPATFASQFHPQFLPCSLQADSHEFNKRLPRLYGMSPRRNGRP